QTLRKRQVLGSIPKGGSLRPRSRRGLFCRSMAKGIMRARQILNQVWQWLSVDKRLVEALIALLIIQIVVLFLPQAPVSISTSPVYARWLAGLHPTLKMWATPLAALGLLTVRASLWMRALLAWLALLVAARCGNLLERGKAWSPSRRWLQALACVAGVLIVVGWGMQTVWGWKQSDVLAWPATPITIPERGLTLPARDDVSPNRFILLRTGRYGLYFVPKGSSVGLVAQALDAQGQVLPLLPSAHDEPQEELHLALTVESPETYFALPQMGYVFRISRLREADGPVQVQVYRSADGELLVETTLQDDGVLFADDIRLELQRDALPRFEAVYNPGAPLEGVGMLALLVTVLGHYCLCRRVTTQATVVELDSEGLSTD
ncbi:MAG: hypothetical protein JXA33_22410, partial [Anaerolineae bacterium]|nr:hypothetical protein [Anaerolineae bacterium]